LKIGGWWKNGEVAVFLTEKLERLVGEVQQNREILKCGKSDEIMKSKNANLIFFLFVCLFLLYELFGI